MTKCEIVRKYYPKSQVMQVGKLYEVYTAGHAPVDGKTNALLRPSYMGQGKSKKAAWNAAYNNWIK